MIGRIAYCVIPESGGLFRFYRNLRMALAPHKWTVFAACIGPNAKERWDKQFSDDGCVLLAPDETDPKRQAMDFAAWVERNHIDIVMPMDNPVAASAVSHLPSEVRLVTRCSSSSLFAYKTSLICIDRLSRVVAMTPRQVQGLVRFKNISEQRVSMIPHGVDFQAFSHNGRQENTLDRRKLKIIYLGRLDDKTKGTLWLPQITERLARRHVIFQFDIFGDGDDRPKLAQLLRRNGLDRQCKLRGTIESNRVAEILSEYDILVLPSRVEGFPNALAEAMAAGVVPIVSHIRGVTDFIVNDGITGILCRVGDTKTFAEAITALDRDRRRLSMMCRATRQAAEERFSLERMGRDYDRLFREVLLEPPTIVSPRSWSDFHLERAYKPGWQSYLPQSIKNIARRYVC